MSTYQVPMCLICKHYRKAQRCDAFPKRIPQGILTSRFDHRKRFRGDNEICFEPREDVSEDEIKRILSIFDCGE
jgi:hypothetical protein